MNNVLVCFCCLCFFYVRTALRSCEQPKKKHNSNKTSEQTTGRRNKTKQRKQANKHNTHKHDKHTQIQIHTTRNTNCCLLRSMMYWCALGVSFFVRTALRSCEQPKNNNTQRSKKQRGDETNNKQNKQTCKDTKHKQR